MLGMLGLLCLRPFMPGLGYTPRKAVKSLSLLLCDLLPQNSCKASSNLLVLSPLLQRSVPVPSAADDRLQGPFLNGRGSRHPSRPTACSMTHG